MCAKNNTFIYVRRASNSKRDCDVVALPILTCERLNFGTSVREERLRRMISIVACWHGAKLCAYAARDFRSQQYSVMVMRYAFYALGFRFESHLVDFGFLFVLSTFPFFLLLLFRLTFYVYELVLG